MLAPMNSQESTPIRPVALRRLLRVSLNLRRRTRDTDKKITLTAEANLKTRCRLRELLQRPTNGRHRRGTWTFPGVAIDPTFQNLAECADNKETLWLLQLAINRFRRLLCNRRRNSPRSDPRFSCLVHSFLLLMSSGLEGGAKMSQTP